MEFKFIFIEWITCCTGDINRITVEFKFDMDVGESMRAVILIESQWNLNFFQKRVVVKGIPILIESQWNLNRIRMFFE